MNLLIGPQYPYPANHAVVNTVYEGLLPARGHRVHVVRPMAGITQVQEVAAPWPNGSMIVYPDEPVGGRLANIARSARQSRWVAEAIRRFRDVPLDAILVRNDLATSSAALADARRRGIPFVYQLSSPDAEFTISRGRELGGAGGAYMRLRGALGLAARRRMSRQASAVLAISDSMRAHLETEDGLDPARVFSFPMGVTNDEAPTPDRIRQLRQELQLPVGRTIVYSGVIDPVRQSEWMLDVFDRVRARITDAAFLVVTYQSDDRRRLFEDEVRRRQSNVRVVGPVPFREVSTYLRCADVAMSPYPPMMEHRVASPTKSLEALAAGVPVVGNSEVDEHAVILGASGGGVAVPWDQAAFADAIVSMLEREDDRHRMGASGRDWVLTHRTYEHLTAYLEQILGAASRPDALRLLPHSP